MTGAESSRDTLTGENAMTTPRPTIYDISDVLALARDYGNGATLLVSNSMRLIREWTDCGCDIKRDIIPTVTELMKKNPRIGSWRYFEKAVLTARDARHAAELLAEKQGIKSGPTPAQTAQLYAWKRKHGKWLAKDELAWLTRYEQQHGAVAP